MTAQAFRPWGRLNWILDRGPTTRWSIIGCFGTEKRSLAAPMYLRGRKQTSSIYMVRVEDAPSRYDPQIDDRLAQRRSEWEAGGGTMSEVRLHRPGDAIGQLIGDVRSFLDSAGSSVLLDITSMPKRVFFPLVKILRKEKRIANLLATYTVPASYPPVPIAADFQDWQPLPLFSGDPSLRSRLDMMVVGIGFMAMRLREEINPSRRELPIKLIFPFPPGPPGFHRSWQMVRDLEETRQRQTTEIRRVDATDASDTFDHLLTMTKNGQRAAILAPFGPKPVSLAMCLFADETNAPVYYTQPRAYHPDYSLGIKEVEGLPEIHAYYLRMKGANLYGVR